MPLPETCLLHAHLQGQQNVGNLCWSCGHRDGAGASHRPAPPVDLGSTSSLSLVCMTSLPSHLLIGHPRSQQGDSIRQRLPDVKIVDCELKTEKGIQLVTFAMNRYLLCHYAVGCAVGSS